MCGAIKWCTMKARSTSGVIRSMDSASGISGLPYGPRYAARVRYCVVCVGRERKGQRKRRGDYADGTGARMNGSENDCPPFEKEGAKQEKKAER